MKSILVLCPEWNDSTSFYRAAGPLGRLRQEMDLGIQVMSQVSWANVMLCDLVFALRPNTPEHVKIIMMAKNLGKPVWVDLDDDVTSIPESNPAYRVFGSTKTQEAVKACIVSADVVTVSTPHLKSKLSLLNGDIRVIPNALDEKAFPGDDWDRIRKPTVLWRGSGTHDEDLMSYTSSIASVASNHPKVEFAFMGNPFWWTMRQMPSNTKRIPAVEIQNYYPAISSMAPKVMQVPLQDNSFNRSKSNIAHIEGCYAGAVTLAPAWEEWKIPGVVTYENPKEYAVQLDGILKMDQNKIMSKVSEGFHYIYENLTLGKVNKLRKDLLMSLIS